MARATTKKTATPTGASRASAKKTPAKKSSRANAPAKKSAAKKAPAKTSPTRKSTAKKATAKKAPAKKTTAKKATAKKAPAKRTSTKKSTAKKAAATTKAPVKKAATKKSAAIRAPASRSASTRASTKKAAAKKSAPTSRRPGKSSPGRPGKSSPGRPAHRRLAVKADEKPWTAKELAAVRTGLGEERARLRSELNLVEVELHDLMRDAGDGAGNDQADVGSTTFERDHEMSLANNAREMLAQIERALDRIEDGSYGRCESCGQPIGKMRVMAFPRATLCLSCKQREERR
ncbi:MAG TPA: TraR/DksA C4-type zinc finger protein [Nocardioidaceae bacterium]|nr:TraR/DksA C4-type zinc finger protein [Nocardioidaceae bacterium]